MRLTAGMPSPLDTLFAATTPLLCVGLDPAPDRYPPALARDPDRVYRFCREIVAATADVTPVYKPQFAHFAAQGATEALARLIAAIRELAPHAAVILDAKRGDIGSTAEHYAHEAFAHFGADAVTVSPYLGGDSLAPFLAWEDRAVFILGHTSNPGASELQDLELKDGRKLYQAVADLTPTWEALGKGRVGLVAGATWPAELADIRQRVGERPLLVPGIGAQGGDVAAVVAHGRNARGGGLVINSSRGILYAERGNGFAEGARAAAAKLAAELAATAR